MGAQTTRASRLRPSWRLPTADITARQHTDSRPGAKGKAMSGRPRRSAALAASVALTTTNVADVPPALRSFQPATRKRPRAQPKKAAVAAAAAGAGGSGAAAASPSRKRAKQAKKQQQQKQQQQQQQEQEQQQRAQQLSESSAAAHLAPFGNVAPAARLSPVAALPSPVPDDLPCTPGLREAVEASRTTHEAAFAAEKMASLQRACEWAQQLPPARPSAVVSHAVGTASVRYPRAASLADSRGVKRRSTCTNNQETVSRVIPPVQMPFARQLPGSCSWIGLTKNFKVREDDEDEVPRFIPYFGDATSAVGEEAVRLFTNDKLRIKLPVNIVADRVFTDVASQFTVDNPLLRELSHLLGVTKEHFADKLEKPQPASEACLDDKSVDEATSILFDSYRNLFCRRCYVYDCRDHGAGQALPESREATAMNIMNTATVVANESLLRSLTTDAESAEQLPELGISSLPSCGLESKRRHAGSVSRRPLSGTKGLQRPPSDGGRDGPACSLSSGSEQGPCSDRCFRCSPAAAVSQWSLAEEVATATSYVLRPPAPPRR